MGWPKQKRKVHSFFFLGAVCSEEALAGTGVVPEADQAVDVDCCSHEKKAEV